MSPKLALVGLSMVCLMLFSISIAAGRQEDAGGGRGQRSVSIALPKGSRPEGVTKGPHDDLFVTSLLGAVYRVDLEFRRTAKIISLPGVRTSGLKYREDDGLLYVPGGASGKLYVFKPKWTGAGYTVAAPRVVRLGSTLTNDIAVGRNAVYITDSREPFVYRVKVCNRTATTCPYTVTKLPLPTSFRATGPNQFRGNGIAVTKDDRALIIANLFTRQLFYYDIRTKTATPLSILGDVRADGILLQKGDAELWVGNQPLNQVVRIDLDLSRKRGTIKCVIGSTRGVPFVNPTTIAAAGGRLWVVNAKFSLCPTQNCPNLAFEVIGFKANDFCPK